MNLNALYTLTYGVFILGAENNGAKNACIINTCQQVASETPKVSISVLKSNLTHYMIGASNKFSVSILGKEAKLDQIAHFGLNSGRDKNKFENMVYDLDGLGTPVIKEGAIATLSCKVAHAIDLGSHTLFIGEIVEAEQLQEMEPMTYAFYRSLKAGARSQKAQYECAICHYLYEGEIPFEDLPEDYICPVCGKPKAVFHKL